MEALKILSLPATSTNYGWQAFVHTPEETLTPLNLPSVNFIRDYGGAFGDEITVTMTFGMGAFARRIFPHRERLEVTLKKVPLIENQDQQDTEGEIQAERFTAILIGKFLSPTVGQGMESNDEFALDISQLQEVSFQLLDKATEQLRVLMTGGVARSTNVQDLLTTMISTHSANVKVDGERALKGVDMVPADNKDIKEQIVVTQGTRLIDLSDFVQKRIGVYNAGIGSYIQNRYWYIFPLYDTSDFNKRVKTLTMLVMPERKLSNVERTFNVEGNSLTILVTGQTGFKDDAGSNYQNYGNGVRFSNAAKMMDENSDTSDNKTRLSRKANNNEFVTDASATLKYAPVASNRITANPFPNLSMQAAKRGGLFKAVWENSDHSLIYPGMVTKIIYSDKGEISEVYGIVQSLHGISHKPAGMTTEKFKNQTVLNVFVNNQLKPVDE